MRKLFEIDINEDFRRAIISQYFLMIFTFLLCLTVRTHERSIIQFGFVIEFLIIAIVFRFYFQAQKKRNYAYWGLTFLVGGYLFFNILHYTFVDYNIFILYITFLAGIFLAINSYVMSSPLFYPRVQWWEYDFRYRGDLKIIVKDGSACFDGRLTDLRRGSGSVEIFGYLNLDSTIEIELDLDEHIYQITGEIKTNKQTTPGRPTRYGVKFDMSDTDIKKIYNDIKRQWDHNKKAKIRNKFSSIKNEI